MLLPFTLKQEVLLSLYHLSNLKINELIPTRAWFESFIMYKLYNLARSFQIIPSGPENEKHHFRFENNRQRCIRPKLIESYNGNKVHSGIQTCCLCLPFPWKYQTSLHCFVDVSLYGRSTWKRWTNPLEPPRIKCWFPEGPNLVFAISVPDTNHNPTMALPSKQHAFSYNGILHLIRLVSFRTKIGIILKWLFRSIIITDILHITGVNLMS
jgi:hypothetical protein